MQVAKRLKIPSLVIALLSASAGAAFIVARLLGFQVSVRDVSMTTAALAIPILLLIPVVVLAERQKTERPEIYWLLLLLGFLLTGLVMAGVALWLAL